MRTIVIVAVAAAALNLLLALVCRDMFGLVQFVMLLAVVALAAAAIGLISFVLKPVEPDARRRGRMAFAVASVLGSAPASLVLADAVAQHDTGAAKAYCEALVPRLDEYRHRHGEYPRDIKVLGDIGGPPRLLAGGSYYRSDGRTFRFSFYDPTGFWDAFEYTNDTRRWERPDW